MQLQTNVRQPRGDGLSHLSSSDFESATYSAVNPIGEAGFELMAAFGKGRAWALTAGALVTIYALSGTLCAVAGILMAARFNSVRVGHGEALLLVTVLIGEPSSCATSLMMQVSRRPMRSSATRSGTLRRA